MSWECKDRHTHCWYDQHQDPCCPGADDRVKTVADRATAQAGPLITINMCQPHSRTSAIPALLTTGTGQCSGEEGRKEQRREGQKGARRPSLAGSSLHPGSSTRLRVRKSFTLWTVSKVRTILDSTRYYQEDTKFYTAGG